MQKRSPRFYLVHEINQNNFMVSLITDDTEDTSLTYPAFTEQHTGHVLPQGQSSKVYIKNLCQSTISLLQQTQMTLNIINDLHSSCPRLPLFVIAANQQFLTLCTKCLKEQIFTPQPDKSTQVSCG